VKSINQQLEQCQAVSSFHCGSVARPIDTSDKALHNYGAMSGFEQTQNNQLGRAQH